MQHSSAAVTQRYIGIGSKELEDALSDLSSDINKAIEIPQEEADTDEFKKEEKNDEEKVKTIVMNRKNNIIESTESTFPVNNKKKQEKTVNKPNYYNDMLVTKKQLHDHTMQDSLNIMNAARQKTSTRESNQKHLDLIQENKNSNL